MINSCLKYDPILLVMKFIMLVLVTFLFFSCKKDIVLIAPQTTELSTVYTKYTIFKGDHYCDKSTFKSFSDNQMNFKVKFDSTAIYQSILPENQYDINKLYGFSEGYDHHVNSARIGWAWNKGALRLYPYVYAKTVGIMKEISEVKIGQEIPCAIIISEKEYVFNVNDKTITIPRALEGAAVAGYCLYPYFGGDEVAPHDTYISIVDIKK